MAGAGKKRAAHARKNGNGDNTSSGSPKSDDAPSSSSPSNAPQSVQGRFDGNRDPAVAAAKDPAPKPQNNNLDLGALANFRYQNLSTETLPQRRALNGTGKSIPVRLNTFNVRAFPQKAIWQYDVQVGNGAEKRGLIRKAWESQAVKAVLKDPLVIFDGNKLAWMINRLEEDVVIFVDLDKENGRTPPQGKEPDIKKVAIRRPHKITFDVLIAWLNRQSDWTDACFEAISFLDHLMREEPSKKYTMIRRNFFARGEKRFMLGGGIEAFKGVYASIRPVSNGLKAPGILTVNVDVANGSFWAEGNIVEIATMVCGAKDVHDMINMCKLDHLGYMGRQAEPLMRLKKVHIITKHREKGKLDHYVINDFSHLTALTAKVDLKSEGRTVTVEEYFWRRYRHRLQYPKLPLIETTKNDVLVPMEMAWIDTNQRYNLKLNDVQTAAMIKFAVTPPRDRWNAIDHGLGMLNWGQDRYLAHYGLQISTEPVLATARLLPNPQVEFQKQMINPGTTGRWDLKGKKFYKPHPRELKSWGICVIPGRGAVSQEQANNFLRSFKSIFAGHGANITNQEPPVIQATGDAGKAVEQIYNAAGNKVQMKPQLLIFIVPNKDSETYQRIKKSADCRYGIPSQVLQSAHVVKNQAQYISNICMKINAKMGGCTARAAAGILGKEGWFSKPGLIIGADVSHGAPGSKASSIAAITVSKDRDPVTYMASCETNGSRVEMITSDNWDKLLIPMIKTWKMKVSNNRSPEIVYYFRDGVSEGQYAHVMDQEVADIKRILTDMDPKTKFKMTVVVCSKRHHVRFFPGQGAGDKNGNPLPGTLVETNVTHPREWDWYLCAHSAIKGTARPVHYHTLLDEQNLPPERLQNMIYEASYQYVRSTTPVSLHPAIYYAHLAAARAISHVRAEQKIKEQAAKKTKQSSSKYDQDVLPLLPIPDGTPALDGMWFV